jgi:hypothetical protein
MAKGRARVRLQVKVQDPRAGGRQRREHRNATAVNVTRTVIGRATADPQAARTR